MEKYIGTKWFYFTVTQSKKIVTFNPFGDPQLINIQEIRNLKPDERILKVIFLDWM